MSTKSRNDRERERIVSREEFVVKLRRLADAIEAGEPFIIQVAGQRIKVPLRAVASIEHEREGEDEELELQLKWKRERAPRSQR